MRRPESYGCGSGPGRDHGQGLACAGRQCLGSPRSPGWMNLMMSSEDERSLERALRAARDTRFLAVGDGVRHDAAGVFSSQFGDAARGDRGRRADLRGGRPGRPGGVPPRRPRPGRPVRVRSRRLCRDRGRRAVQEALATVEAIPVAVGSGTINDLTKLAAPPPGPAVHGGRDRGLDGRLHRLRGVDHGEGVEADVRLPRAPGRAGRPRRDRPRPPRDERVGLRRPAGQERRRGRLDPGRRRGRGADRPRGLGHRPGPPAVLGRLARRGRPGRARDASGAWSTG